jgi:O-antigen/teichoic acid export membrane protein
MKDLKEKTIRGGFARMCAQVANFVLRLASLVILARLLNPKDFGLVGMVTAFTGVLMLFRDFGLSSAAIQRATVTEEQISTLFWINVLVGLILAVVTVALAPIVAAFYHEPRLLAVTAVLAVAFLFNAAGVQHSVLMQRQMRFTALAVISTISLIIGTTLAIGGARAGYGYWALVAMSLAFPLSNTIGLWVATTWIPGMPHRRVGILSMMRFGGTLTLNGLILYCANNMDKVLLGRFWGADALGIYGRAFQLINIPTDNLNSAVGEVAFSALSRLQDDPPRLKNYFLKGYSLVLALTVPITAACTIFSHDMILVLLGPKWLEASPLFRLLAPTIFVFAIVNPMGWLLSALGLVGRSLKIALFLAPTMIAAYAAGLHYGPKGVAFGYSAILILWVIPLIVWAVHGTVISFWDVARVASRPLISCGVAAAIVVPPYVLGGSLLPVFPRLALGIAILFAIYVGMLLYVMGQKTLYVNLVRGFKSRPTVEQETEKKVLVSEGVDSWT